MNTDFDVRYEIRLAQITEIDSIMRYIGEFWHKGHIMSVDKELFTYEFVNNNDVNFLIAIDKSSGAIEAVLGFLNCSNPNNEVNAKRKDLWGSFWKVNDTHPNMPLLGIEMARRVFPLTGCRMLIGNGANPETSVPLRRLYFRDKTVRLKHYYCLRSDKSEFSIAVINQVQHVPESIDPETYITHLKSIDEVNQVFCFDKLDLLPYKDAWYTEKRYFRYPYYKYYVFGAYRTSNQIGALIIMRIAEANGARALRIVDYIGNHLLFTGLYKAIQTLLQEENCEYADFITHGFNERLILSAGFILRTESDNNIIPNYFEPFIQKNVDIWAHYSTEGTAFFKADGDQDRPNIFRNR